MHTYKQTYIHIHVKIHIEIHIFSSTVYLRYPSQLNLNTNEWALQTIQGQLLCLFLLFYAFFNAYFSARASAENIAGEEWEVFQCVLVLLYRAFWKSGCSCNQLSFKWCFEWFDASSAVLNFSPLWLKKY